MTTGPSDTNQDFDGLHKGKFIVRVRPPINCHRNIGQTSAKVAPNVSLRDPAPRELFPFFFFFCLSNVYIVSGRIRFGNTVFRSTHITKDGWIVNPIITPFKHLTAVLKWAGLLVFMLQLLISICHRHRHEVNVGQNNDDKETKDNLEGG